MRAKNRLQSEEAWRLESIQENKQIDFLAKNIPVLQFSILGIHVRVEHWLPGLIAFQPSGPFDAFVI
jgi:hypothetical protein